MQDRYTGDVGDFGKYGLLRSLAGINPPSDENLRLGVVWYRTDPGHVADPKDQEDGKHRTYLRETAQRYRDCDPALHAAMMMFLNRKRRLVKNIPALGIFPDSTSYYDANLGFDHLPWKGPKTSPDRQAHRRDWFTGALARTAQAELVFLDPDNGLECASHKPHTKKGPKYVARAELAPFLDRRQSLVVYHHTGRNGGTAKQQAEAQLRLIGRPGFFLLFRRGTCRAFIVIPIAAHYRLLRARAAALVDSEWGRQGHFSLH